jgi:hypothetical protein
MMMDRVREEVNNGGGNDLLNLQKHIDRLVGSTINRLIFGFAFADVRFFLFHTISNSIQYRMNIKK